MKCNDYYKIFKKYGRELRSSQAIFYAELLETSCTLVASTKVISDYDKEAGWVLLNLWNVTTFHVTPVLLLKLHDTDHIYS